MLSSTVMAILGRLRDADEGVRQSALYSIQCLAQYGMFSACQSVHVFMQKQMIRVSR